MADFPNPYFEERDKSQGELAQEYAAMFNMALIYFDLDFTDREREAIPIVAGALMRERHKIDLTKLANYLRIGLEHFNLIKQFIPQL